VRYEEAPLEAHGSTVNETDARLFRERWAVDDSAPLRVYVSGTRRDGDNAATSGFVLEDREELWRLIGALSAAYYGWPADHR
jgi:hypothetical protein